MLVELKGFVEKKNLHLLIWLKIFLLSCHNMKRLVKNQAMVKEAIHQSDRP